MGPHLRCAGRAGATGGCGSAPILLQSRRVQQYQPRQLAACGGGNDLPLETAVGEQWHTTAMIEMGVSEQQEIYGRRIKAEIIGVVLDQFPATLVKTAIHQDTKKLKLPLVNSID